ncbi:O-antigen ligase family protein [Azospirillum sp.]|uniref:O-antigen ligase family protein n=1 Tax=Azospirillum sp. TaxID=34012 RepID=UPI002D3CC4F7|nr:O-antigen ligase family protein [Azospirillum sp.]HYD69837.1 O-antigen ligase family protein [Azospirillum sp.]
MFALTNTTVFRLVLAAVLLAPLPLGGNRPWAWSLLAVTVAVLLLLWCLGVLAGKARAPVPPGRLWMAIVPFALVLLWAFVQTLDLVPRAGWHPLWAEAATALGQPVAGGVSVDPEMSRTALMRLLCYGGVFWLAVQLGRERSRAREALVAVAVAGAVYASYGLIVHFSESERILWLEKWTYIGDVTATFVSRNAYGGYAGLGALCCVALFLHALRPPRAGETRRAYDLTELVMVRALPFLMGAVVIGSALLLSHSRGAFLSTGGGLLALILAVLAGRIVRPRTAIILGVVLGAIGITVLGVSGEETVKRLADTTSDVRTDLFRLTVDAVEDAPWTGHGFGAFLPAFRMYRDASLAADLVWDFAHNVHLEFAMDLGLPAAVLMYLSLATVVAVCLHGLVRRRRDQIYPAVAVAGATLTGLHGIVDFSPQMPAVAVTLALLLGIGCAQSWRTAEGGTP